MSKSKSSKVRSPLIAALAEIATETNQESLLCEADDHALELLVIAGALSEDTGEREVAIEDLVASSGHYDDQVKKATAILDAIEKRLSKDPSESIKDDDVGAAVEAVRLAYADCAYLLGIAVGVRLAGGAR